MPDGIPCMPAVPFVCAQERDTAATRGAPSWHERMLDTLVANILFAYECMHAVAHPKQCTHPECLHWTGADIHPPAALILQALCLCFEASKSGHFVCLSVVTCGFNWLTAGQHRAQNS